MLRATGFGGGLLLATLVLGAFGPTPPARADETTKQLWATYQLYKPMGPNQWGFQVEGRSNAPDEEDKWKSIEGRARVDFYPTNWIDTFPEGILRGTYETEDLNSLMLNLRGGIRFSLPNTRDFFHRERVPLERFHAGILLRMEYRHFWYSDESTDSSWRARARLEFQVSINNRSMATNRTLYLRTDAEAFIPIGDESPETFANRMRIRLGLGYRYTYNWRFEVLGVWQESRDTLTDDSLTREFMLNLRLRHHI